MSAPARRRPLASSRRGFSLLELLVALAIFALAAAALLTLSAENTRLAQHLETRTLAGVVASNLAVESVIAAELSQEDAGAAAMAGRDWRWSRTLTTTADPSLVRIDIRVSDADAPDAVAASLSLFREQAP